MQYKAFVYQGARQPDGGGFVEIQATSNFTHTQTGRAGSRQQAQH